MKITIECDKSFNFEEVLYLAKLKLEDRIETYEKHNALVGSDITFNNMQISKSKDTLKKLLSLKYEVTVE